MTQPEAILYGVIAVCLTVVACVGMIGSLLLWKASRMSKLLDRASEGAQEILTFARQAIEESNQVNFHYKKEIGVNCEMEESRQRVGGAQ